MRGLVVSELNKFAQGRYSETLVNQLVYLPYWGVNPPYQFIVPEIAHLEDKRCLTQTVKEEAFRRSEMRGLYKKHFYLPSFLAKNIQNCWGLAEGSKSTKFNDRLKRKLEAYSPSEENAKKLSSDIVNAMFEEMKNKKKTGEYIIFQKHDNKNYYLCIGIHGEDDEILGCVKQARRDFLFLENLDNGRQKV